MASARKFFVGGNWKMNGNRSTIEEIVANLNKSEINGDTGMVQMPIWPKQGYTYTKNS